MGVNPQGANDTYLTAPLQYIRPHHRKMARMLVGGVRPSEIAMILGFTTAQITHVLATPHIQIEVARLEAMSDEIAVDMRLDIQRMAQDAVEIMDEDLHMPITNRFERKLRQDAAKDILDRAGVRKSGASAPQRHLHLHQNVKDMSDDDLRDSVFDLTKENV